MDEWRLSLTECKAEQIGARLERRMDGWTNDWINDLLEVYMK